MGGVAKVDEDDDSGNKDDTSKEKTSTEASEKEQNNKDVKQQCPTNLETLMVQIEAKVNTLSIPIKLIRELADKAQTELETAKTYFVYDGCTTQHVRIALELSRLWDVVSRFCPGEAEQL